MRLDTGHPSGQESAHGSFLGREGTMTSTIISSGTAPQRGQGGQGGAGSPSRKVRNLPRWAARMSAWVSRSMLLFSGEVICQPDRTEPSVFRTQLTITAVPFALGSGQLTLPAEVRAFRFLNR